METGSGKLKCVLDKDEGTVDIDAEKCVVTVKVQGPNPVGLRGLLWRCFLSAVHEFSGLAIERETLVCACGGTRSAAGVRKKFTRGKFRVECYECDEVLPTDDLLPGALSLATDDPTAAANDYKRMLELLASADKAKSRGKFGPGKQREWRRLVAVYLYSLVTPAVPDRNRAPPLLWLPRPSPSR